MAEKTSGGGSRAAKKRRKTSSITADSNEILTKEQQRISPGENPKKSRLTADALTRTALGLANDANLCASASIANGTAKTSDDLLKLSIAEVLNLEEIIDIDCLSRAATVLSIILKPYDRVIFYSEYWEKRPMHCAKPAEKKKCVKGLFSSKQFRNIIKSHSIMLGLDVTTSQATMSSQMSINEESEPENSDDAEPVEAKESELLKHYRDGFSIRLLCPQKFRDPLWSLLSILEVEFGCPVGCRVDLMPPGGQGFKPKYDNFDSIILQLEGQSKWRLYSSQEGFELPRNSSYEIELTDLPAVVSVEAILDPGDSLYIPKGWTYRQENPTSECSLFLTVKTNEGNTAADFLEAVLPEALAEAIEKKTEMRRSLPRSFHSFMGVASSENDVHPLRNQFHEYTRGLLASVVEEAMEVLDAAADQNAKAFLAARLPVPLTAEEESRTAAGAPTALIYPYTLLRMVRPGVARCIVEDGMAVVYHCMDNSRELYGSPLQPLEFELDDGPAIEALLSAYPEAVLVSEIPHPSEELEDKISLAQVLYREGFLLIHDDASKPQEEGVSEDDDDPF